MALIKLDMQGVREKADENAFWSLRGRAIQSYANVEQSLARMLSYLGDMEQAVADVIFFKINATRSRNEILDKLFKRKFQGEHNLFWNSVLKAIGVLDQERNIIVHWNTITHLLVDEAGTHVDYIELMPPSTWERNIGEGQRFTVEQIKDFMARCDVYSRALNMFHLVCCVAPSDVPQEVTDTWRPIFQQPLAYPPPPDHLLSPTPATHQDPPPPSPA